jgi:hypothetical protein
MSSAHVADYYDDANQQTLHRINRTVTLPEFVKDARAETRADLADKPRLVYGDPTVGKFPCHTKQATWFAQAYFLASRHHYTTKQADWVQARIENAASFFAIGDEIRKLRNEWDSKQAAAPLTDDDHAVVLNMDGTPLRYFPIHNAESVKAASEQFFQNRTKFPYATRRTAARRILDKAASHGAFIDPAIDDYLFKAAGYGSAMPEKVANALGQRAYMLTPDRAPLRDRLVKMAQMIRQIQGFPRPANMEKLANAVDHIDRATGLYNYYDEGGVPMPEELFFNVTTKKAASISSQFLRLQTGNTVPFSVLNQLPLDKVAQALGDDFYRAVLQDGGMRVDPGKFCKIAETLPRGDAQLLEQAIRSVQHGHEKAGRAPMSANLRFDKAEMEQHFRDRGLKISEPNFTLEARKE